VDLVEALLRDPQTRFSTSPENIGWQKQG